MANIDFDAFDLETNEDAQTEQVRTEYRDIAPGKPGETILVVPVDLTDHGASGFGTLVADASDRGATLYHNSFKNHMFLKSIAGKPVNEPTIDFINGLIAAEKPITMRWQLLKKD